MISCTVRGRVRTLVTSSFLKFPAGRPSLTGYQQRSFGCYTRANKSVSKRKHTLRASSTGHSHTQGSHKVDTTVEAKTLESTDMSHRSGGGGSRRSRECPSEMVQNGSKKRKTGQGAVASGHSGFHDGGGGDQVKGKKKRRSKGPKNEFIGAINMAAKHCDRSAAMAAFRGARAAGVKLQQETMNSLLYILVGGDAWSVVARRACDRIVQEKSLPKASETAKGSLADIPLRDPIAGSKSGNLDPSSGNLDPYMEGPAKEDDFRDEVFAYMEEAQMFEGEMAYTAQARLAACHADDKQALVFLEKMISAEIPAKLRMFMPVLVCYAALGKPDEAFRIEQMIRDQSLDLTEMEFRLLLEASSKSGTYAQFSRLLGTIGEERTFLEESTIQHIHNYFTSDLSNDAFETGKALAGKQMWSVKRINVEADGYSDFAGGKLAPIDLEDADWEKFLEGVRKMAMSNEKNKNFEMYLNWFSNNGPYDIIVDGANVAMHGQNFQGSYFRFDQIDSILALLEREFPGRRVLVILHVGRLHSGPARHPRAQDLIKRLRSNGQLYSTPVGSNDDWYWLYAAIMAKQSSLVVSNDECRDHLFQLLTPKYFLKWKERHMVRFSFTKSYLDGLQANIQLPAPYTPCIQEVQEGTWMVPGVDGKWLCAKAL